MNLWDADIHLSEADARQLVATQFPTLASAPFTHLSRGWDNEAYLADNRIVFRFPRRQVAAKLIETEIKALPLLAPHLPLPISVSKHIGHPTADCPYTWAGYDLLPGATVCRTTWTDDQRTANAPILAHFLKALHTIPVDAATRAWAPGDEIGRTDYPSRLPKLLERLDKIALSRPDLPVQRLRELAGELLERCAIRDTRSVIPGDSELRVPSSEFKTSPISNLQSAISNPTCWVHGDFYVRHFITNKSNQITGVIDWGDVHLGDPALDLSIAFTFLPRSAHAQFRDEYGGIDDDTCNRAQFRALYHSAALVDYSLGIEDADLLSAGEFALIALSTPLP